MKFPNKKEFHLSEGYWCNSVHIWIKVLIIFVTGLVLATIFNYMGIDVGKRPSSCYPWPPSTQKKTLGRATTQGQHDDEDGQAVTVISFLCLSRSHMWTVTSPGDHTTLSAKWTRAIWCCAWRKSWKTLLNWKWTAQTDPGTSFYRLLDAKGKRRDSSGS